MVRSEKPDDGYRFLPLDKLEEILTEEQVSCALARALAAAGKPLDGLESIARSVVCPVEGTDVERPRHLRTRRQIFAILSLVEKEDTIGDFIDEGIYDSDLPFILDTKVREGHPDVCMLSRTVKGEQQTVKLFLKWRDVETESFHNQQWKVNIPVFQFDEKKNSKPPHYDLKRKALLPFLSAEEVGSGYSSAVHKVEIHPKHHNQPCEPGKTLYYAVKKIRSSTQGVNVNKEVSNLGRFADSDHPHLIKLLWTYKHGDDFHLVFPCADGNLLDFWEAHDSPLKGDRPAGALWVARQCLGIVEGLSMIHTDDRNGLGEMGRKKYGRHGDLKPENILWFRNPDSQAQGGGYSPGELRISDFGFMGFHGSYSRFRVNAETVGMTPTYRPPEYDVFTKVSAMSDIWSLGCVLLEFVTWYLDGWQGVSRFRLARADEENHGMPGDEMPGDEIPGDTFFSYLRRPIFCARAKKSVEKEFEALYEHPDGSDFTDELLQCIQEHLLRLEPTKRAECPNIYARFKTLYEACEKTPDYCLRRSKEPPSRRATDLSLLVSEELKLSPQLMSSLRRGHTWSAAQTQRLQRQHDLKKEDLDKDPSPRKSGSVPRTLSLSRSDNPSDGLEQVAEEENTPDTYEALERTSGVEMESTPLIPSPQAAQPNLDNPLPLPAAANQAPGNGTHDPRDGYNRDENQRPSRFKRLMAKVKSFRRRITLIPGPRDGYPKDESQRSSRFKRLRAKVESCRRRITLIAWRETI